ncbi:MAG: methyltransferase domain-containing protein [Candidatus Baltobacteraceae bacterium]
MSLFSRIADHRDPRSLASRLRAQRLAFFRRLLASVTGPVTILDVGGTVDFWKSPEFENDWTRVVLLNVRAEAIDDARFESVLGDARDLGAFADRSIDVVYSNSVIEHVGTFDDQRKMANEIRRIARRYFVQTPNALFPIEPHFLVPGFQFMPLAMRTLLLQHARLGWVPRERDPQRARDVVGSVRLLTAGQMRTLFPEAVMYRERLLGMTKSVIAYHGW